MNPYLDPVKAARLLGANDAADVLEAARRGASAVRSRVKTPGVGQAARFASSTIERVNYVASQTAPSSFKPSSNRLTSEIVADAKSKAKAAAPGVNRIGSGSGGGRSTSAPGGNPYAPNGSRLPILSQRRRNNEGIKYGSPGQDGGGQVGPRARGLRPGQKGYDPMGGLRGVSRDRANAPVVFGIGMRVDVPGNDKVVVQSGWNGGVESVFRLNSIWAPGFTKKERADVEWFFRQMLQSAKQLSRGRLSYSKLAKMNHPYGKGPLVPSGDKRRKIPGTLASKRFRQLGVGSMAVVNRHTGVFERDWQLTFVWDSQGVTAILTNIAPYAEYLAFGTPLMKAHGPFVVAVELWQDQALNAFRAGARAAQSRARAAEVTS